MSVVLILVLPIVAVGGCASHRKNLVARDLGYLEQGTQLRGLHVELQDGSTEIFKRAVVTSHGIQGATVDGRQISVSNSDIRRAWRKGVDTQKTLVAIVPFAIAAVVAWGLAASLAGDWE